MNALTHATHFDRDTVLTPVRPGVFQAQISPDFWAVVGPNGGYLAAIALRAILHVLGDAARAPRSLHLRYLSTAVAAEAEVHVETLRAGRTVTVMTARISQAGKDIIQASAALGAPASNVSYCDAQMPQLPAREQCEPVPKLLPINERFDMWRGLGAEPRKGEHALSGGWIRLAEPRMPDALLMAAIWDAWTPTPLFRRIEERFTGAAPTIEASLYFRTQLPLPESTPNDCFALRAQSLMAADGYFDESAEIWSPSGQLLVQSRQLALIY
ncbi:MAG TPA: thioesterase family protein [Polyangiales bacterium]